MIQVRDKLADNKYKRKLTYAVSKDCPCMPCFNSHDCGYRVSSGKWIVQMHCATNYCAGCPKERPQPNHIYKSETSTVCRRCGVKRRL